MFIRADWRDTFPKLGLGRRYIGDGYPACWDLPQRAFLRKGAKYIYLGQDPLGTLNGDHGHVRNYPVLTLDSSSSKLFEALCGGRGAQATCSAMRSEVVLAANLPCDGVECDVQTVRTVQVDRAGKSPVFFEYVREPCVEFAFVEEGRQKPLSNRFREKSVCIDERLQAGVAACKTSPTDWRGAVQCSHFGSERYDYAEAERRCRADGYELGWFDDPTWPASCGRYTLGRSWGNGNCSIQAKVHPDGRVSVVHEFEGLPYIKGDPRLWRSKDKYGFRVDWRSASSSSSSSA